MKPTTMTQDYYDHYQPMLEGIENGYAPLLHRLRAEFGLNFLVENMGGGNEAIRAVMEGGWEVRITDGDDFIQSTLDGRQRVEASDGPLGWTVGIYRFARLSCRKPPSGRTLVSSWAHPSVVKLSIGTLGHFPQKSVMQTAKRG